MALNPNTTGTVGFPNAIAIYYDKKLLERLEIELRFDQFADKKPMPKRSGNEIKWTRYTNFASNTTPLTEGTTPNGLTLQSVQISAIPLQYGDFVTLSDFLIAEAIDPVIEGAQDVLGYRAALTADELNRDALDGNVTNQFAGGVGSEITVATNLTAEEIRKAVKTLRIAGVPTIGGEYQMIIHPAQSFDLQGDTAAGGWLDVSKYTSATPMLRGEVGKLYGARIVESPNVKINIGAGSGGADTYHAYMFGKSAYGNVDLAGQNMKMFAKQLGSAGTEDPLDQRSTVGYKFSHITKVLEAARAIQIYTLAS